MNDTEKQQQQAITASAEALNNFSHRRGTSPLISSPEDLVTEPTPAQRERLIYLVDDAIDTLEANLLSGKSSVRQQAADSILDRAGMSKNARASEEGALNIPAEAIVQVVKGLAAAFGQSVPSPARDVSPTPREAAESSSSSSKQQPSSDLPPSLMNIYRKESKNNDKASS